MPKELAKVISSLQVDETAARRNAQILTTNEPSRKMLEQKLLNLIYR